MKKGRVLVTGGAGFIGSHTADALLKAGYEVRILDGLKPPVHEGRWPEYLPKEAEKIEGDVQNPEDWRRALRGVDAVFHLAAYQDLLPNFSKFFGVNSVGTALLYELLVSEKIPVRKVVVASSQFVYGEGCYQCPKDGEVFPSGRDPERLKRGLWEPVCPECGGAVCPDLLREEDADPRNQYAISKYSQELMAVALGKNYGIPSVALRYSIVQGARQSFRNAYSGVLRIFVQQMLRQKPLPIFEDGRQLRDYVNIEDVVRANLLVLEKPETDFEIFNVGGGRGYAVLDFAGIVGEAFGEEPELDLSAEYRRGDTRHSISDISKLSRLGWKPTRTPRESVQEYLEWIRNQSLEKDYADEALELLRRTGTLSKAQ